ncbi:MAG: polysaccharide deacetylase family protein, partial [Selenomonadaceae bacterium]|nr:polysaccharide deacetylase family protein [Selenomonadaceae bacterium]
RVSDTDTNPTTLKVADFEAQLKYLTDNGYHVIAPDDLLDAWETGKPLPDKPIVLTFDDGHEDIYKNVFPLLQKYNMRATVFIVTDHIGMKDYLSWDVVRALQAGGYMDFESHTMTYKNLTTLKGDKLWNEIYGSKQAIEWALKKPAKFIAYPEGKYTLDAEDTSKEVGFRAGFIEDYGLATNDSNSYVLTRIPVLGSNSHTLLRFQLRLKGSPIFAPLHRFKMDIAEGNPEVADLIFIP